MVLALEKLYDVVQFFYSVCKVWASTNEPNLNGFSIIEIFRNETFRKDTKNKDAQMIKSLKLLLFNNYRLG